MCFFHYLCSLFLTVCPASVSSLRLSMVSVTYSLGTSLVSASAAHELWCAGSLLILLWMFLCPWEVHRWMDGALSDFTWPCPHWMTCCSGRACRSWAPKQVWDARLSLVSLIETLNMPFVCGKNSNHPDLKGLSLGGIDKLKGQLTLSENVTHTVEGKIIILPLKR